MYNLMINNIDSSETLLSEYLRPKTIEELTLPESVKKRFKKMQDNCTIMNMLFYGRPGTGKTTLAQLIGRPEDYEITYVNASANTTVDYVRNEIISMVSVMSLFARRRLMIIDEAEQMSLKAQAALKIIIEQTSENCRFIFITNDITKIDEAIKSRLKVICFDQIPSQASKIIEDYKKRTVEKMKLKNQEMNLEEIEELNDIIVKNYPDYRKIANEMEFAFN